MQVQYIVLKQKTHNYSSPLVKILDGLEETDVIAQPLTALTTHYTFSECLFTRTSLSIANRLGDTYWKTYMYSKTLAILRTP